MPTDRPNEPVTGQSSKPASRRRGRPVGSVSLTPEIEHTIVSFIRAGGFDHAAAEAAGISARTFYDWIQRGEGKHPSRPPTRKLRAFAQAVSRAKAEARVGAEVRVYKERPAYWLAHAARSKPDREGWSKQPAVQGQEQESKPSLEDWIAELDRQQELEQGCSSPQSPSNLQERSNWDGTHRDSD